MRRILPLVGLILFSCLAFSEVSINKSLSGWEISNGHIRLDLATSAQGVQLKSLRCEDGTEWAAASSPFLAIPDKGGARYQFTGDEILSLENGGKQLTLRFKSSAGGVLSLRIKLHPQGAVFEVTSLLENDGQKTLLLNPHIDPLLLNLKTPASGLKFYSSEPGKHGFQPVAASKASSEFRDWLVLENSAAGESLLAGGELGMGMLAWQATVQKSANAITVTAGNILLKTPKSGVVPVFELAPGESVESPLSFVSLAKGDTDNVGNEAYRYLKRYVFPAPMENAPWLTYCIWLTERNAEEHLLKELEIAKRIDVDVFYHDATWYEGASIVPGMNDWSKGLGSYRENKEKFPHGIKNMSDTIRAAGFKFGIWVDPGNVDAARVKAGEIPDEWLVKVDGKAVKTEHPSLSITRELCLGDPKVIEWIKKQLVDIIEKWNIQWVKWDPSATVTYECNRTDHGHGKTNGAYAAYRGRVEITRYLLEKFPNLVGFECDPSLSYSRTNPGPRGLLPGGYTNEFITGPMVSPYVWGSLATAGKGDASASYLTQHWYSASALDYYLRKNLMHGFSFGNINGMSSQLLSKAPAGYLEALERNVYYFKKYRSLLLEDVYHPQLNSAGWSSIQYIKPDSSESVVYVFRDKSPTATTTLKLRALAPRAKYEVTSLNDRPGRERVMSGADLMKGMSLHLPDKWLSENDGVFSQEYANQQLYGSDVLLLHRLPE
jgi:hypothetical protein